MARKPHRAHGGPGVLAVFPSPEEVTAVFPVMSSTVIPHAQEILVRRGDAADIKVTLQSDEDPPSPVAFTGVLRWAAKVGFGETERLGVVVGNQGVIAMKRTYDPAEIELGAGQATVHLRREDTIDAPTSPAVWDLEATSAGAPIPIPPAASLALVTGSPVAVASGLDLTALGVRPGDLLKAQGRLVLITAVLSPVHLETDFEGWATGTVPPGGFELSRGMVQTVASGPFRVTPDVVL